MKTKKRRVSQLPVSSSLTLSLSRSLSCSLALQVEADEPTEPRGLEEAGALGQRFGAFLALFCRALHRRATLRRRAAPADHIPVPCPLSSLLLLLAGLLTNLAPRTRHKSSTKPASLWCFSVARDFLYTTSVLTGENTSSLPPDKNS